MEEKFVGIFLSDPHLRSRIPPSRYSYLSDFEIKWAEVCQLAEEIEADVIGIMGDIYNALVSSSVSHGLVTWTIEQFKKSPVPIITIPGNHDVRLDCDRNHMFKRPYGVLYMSGAVISVSEATCYLTKGVQIWGSSCPMTIDADIKNYVMPKLFKDARAGIMMTHGILVFPGKSTWGSISTKLEDLDKLKLPQLVHLNGHVHDQQVLYKGRTCKFGSPGAFIREFDTLGTLNRTVKVVIVEIDEKNEAKLRLHTLKSPKPFEEVFKVEEIVKRKQRGEHMTQFVELLAEEVKKTTLEDDLFETVDGMNLDVELGIKVKDYLRRAMVEVR